jgi:hypothetical protein
MIETLRQLFFDPHTSRYVGRHRAPSSMPVIALTVRHRATSVAG